MPDIEYNDQKDLLDFYGATVVSCLVDKPELLTKANRLKRKHFTALSTRMVFVALKTLQSNSVPIDHVTLLGTLKQRIIFINKDRGPDRKLDITSPETILTNLKSGEYQVEHFEYYVKELLEVYARVELIKFNEDMADKLIHGLKDPAQAVLERHTQETRLLRDIRIHSAERTLGEHFEEEKDQDAPVLVPTGFKTTR